jgi:hypothetical protein
MLCAVLFLSFPISNAKTDRKCSGLRFIEARIENARSASKRSAFQVLLAGLVASKRLTDPIAFQCAAQ